MITVVTPVSPIPSHPSTAILAETLGTIRGHLPDAEIILMFDGVRAEQEDRRISYEEHIRRALWMVDKHFGGIAPFLFDAHLHQVGMLRSVLDEVRTPLMLFVEQDTPLCPDMTIDWQSCSEVILSGEANSVRFHHESVIPEAHDHLMHGMIGGQFMRTSQFSARPHLASVAYYRHILADHFTPEANCFVEDVMHSVCQEAVKLEGKAGLRAHGLTIYHPEGSIKRSYHTDGRAGDVKYEEQQVF